MKKAVVIYSGGADSLTLLTEMIETRVPVHALSVDYGQRHNVELEYAKRHCEAEKIDHTIIDLSSLREVLAASALTSDAEMPTGHYQAENMRQTVVPNRNAILLNIAAGFATTIGAKTVMYGAHAGDHYIYPDCRPKFIREQSQVLLISQEEPIQLMAPYVNLTKAEIMRIGSVLGIDYVNAWTCYDPQPSSQKDVVVACGVCGSCVERIEAVALSKAKDSTVYANVE